MKKIAVLLLLSLFVAMGFAQKENGKVFIEHPALGKINQLWAAFEKGDQAAYAALLADTVRIFRNGQMFKQTGADAAKGLDWWSKEFENLKVVADTPAYADAIEYDQGGLWVQDWLRIQGTHTKTGINLDLQMHNLYHFNKEGKISGIHHYFNNDIFAEIRNSGRTLENGTVYINHPYILTVRKAVNAYAAKDEATLRTFYAKDARFSNTTMKWRESVGLDDALKGWQSFWDSTEDIYLEQVGYPDCIYYTKNDEYNVYSWWILHTTMKESGKKIAAPIMLSISFDKDGKITRDMAYYSSNQFEE